LLILRKRAHAIRLARLAWPALLIMAVSGLVPSSSHAYVVEPGSSSNQFHLTIDDRVGLTRNATIVASVDEAPSWIRVSEARVDAVHGFDVVVTFDVDTVAPGTLGSVSLRIDGTDSSGRPLFDRTRRFPLIVGHPTDSVQRSYEVQQCCLLPTSVGGQGSVPNRFVLVGNSPNPFGPMTAILFGLPAGGGAVTLTVFDVGGRSVRSMTTPVLSGGYHQINWDGRGDNDRALAPGTYFYRLQSGSLSAAGKMQLLR
jgi:hypothetical protein